jgi:iron complex outermembrane receptor protein
MDKQSLQPLLGHSCFLSATAISLALISSGISAETRQLEEVIVTAQKRTERLQDVPVAVTAINGATLEALNINEVTDLTRTSASLTFGQGNQRQNTGFRIRGIGTSVFTIGIEPSVSVIIDDVSQVQPGQALTNLVDIQQVEVLRGPQSTLFGKNASAGLINVVTKAPAEEFESFIEASITDDDEEKFIGSLSGPLSDSMAYRVSAFYTDHEGYADNLFYNDEINTQETKGIRGKLSWQANEDIDMTLIAFYTEDEGNCCALSFRELDTEARLLGALPVSATNPLTYDRAADDNSDAEVDNDVGSEVEDIGLSFKLNWQLGEHTLTSITAYNEWQYDNSEDVDFSGFDVGAALTGGTISGGIHSLSTTDTDFFSQELRLTSPSSDRFEYLLGVYYADAETDRTFKRPIITSDWLGTAGIKSYAAFGQATWKFNEKLHLTIGARYNYEEIEVEYADLVAGTSYAGDDDEDEVPGKISLQYFISDDTMLFASAAKGHKGQAYDISSGFDQSRVDNPVGSESSESFEIGIKTTMLDQRLQLNAIAFLTEYDDYQAQNTELRGTELLIGVVNVGTLETKGVEVDAVALVGNNLRLSASAAWIDATIDEYPDANCYREQTEAEGCVEQAPGSGVFGQDLAGEDLNNSPDWKVNLAGQYNIPLEELPFDAFVNFNYSWQDEIIFDLLQTPGTEQDSYGIASLSAGISERDDQRYRITLFVENLFDEDYAAAIADLGGLYGGATSIMQFLPRNAQRYIGLKARYAF